MRPFFLLTACIIVGFVGVAVGIVAGHFETFPVPQLRRLTGKTLLQSPPTLVPSPDDPHAYLGNATADIVFLGDSRVAFVEWAEAFPGLRVANRGIAGDTVPGVHSRIDKILAMHPRLVVLEIGVNDLRTSRSLVSIFSDYTMLVNHLKAHTNVLVNTVILTNETHTNQRTILFNRHLIDWCLKNDVSYADANKTLAPRGQLDPALTIDGIHLNSRGTALWISSFGQLLRAPP